MHVWKGAKYSGMSLFGNHVCGYWVLSLLLYSRVCGGEGMWGSYYGCLSRGLSIIYRGSWALESQHDYDLGDDVVCEVEYG
jgi:hypothetical protein